MKRLAVLGVLFLLVTSLTIGTTSAQPTGSGQGGWCCPRMGGAPQGQQRGWYCPWMGKQQTGPPVAKPGQSLTPDQAKALVEQYFSGNPNLKAGKVAEKDGVYEVEVVTKDGSLVDKIQVNKQTGWFCSAY